MDIKHFTSVYIFFKIKLVKFSSPENIKKAEKRLYEVRPGLLKSLEKEHITLFPKVYKRLKKLDMMPKSHRFAGKIIKS